MSQLGTKWNSDRKSIGQSPLDKTQTDLEDAQVAAVNPANEMV